MDCDNGFLASNSDERLLNEQEYRNVTRLWRRAMQKLSTPKLNIDPNKRVDLDEDGNCISEEEKKKLPSEAILKQLAKGKTQAKLKSPLQKFDEVVTKELTNRRLSEDGGISSFENSKKWSCLQFSGNQVSDFGMSKISVEGKVSRGALHGVGREVKNKDPVEAESAALMDAIEKLAQAQAFCRFDAAVKAAEAATASVPPELAEEVAVACAKDYQSEIVDFIHEKIPLSEEKKPIEVIGYIGVTKMKDSM